MIYLSYMSTTWVPILCLWRRCLWFSLSKGQSCRYIGSPKGDKNLPLILIDVKTPHPTLPKSLLRTIEKLLKATNSTPFFFFHERKSISLVLFLLVQTICHLDTCRHTEEFSRARESHLSFALCRHSSAFAWLSSSNSFSVVLQKRKGFQEISCNNVELESQVRKRLEICLLAPQTFFASPSLASREAFAML